MFEMRGSEIALASDPAAQRGDARLVFIGFIRSPWSSREACPKNMREARERGRPADVEILPAFHQGLLGLEVASPIAVLTWLHHAPRNLIVQKPRHASEAKGVFALRTPVRPNPVGLHVAQLLEIDRENGMLRLDAIDVLDGTPVIDIKPFFPSADTIPDRLAERPAGNRQSA